MPVRVSPVGDSRGLSLVGLFLPKADVCKETTKTHPGSPHTERTHPSAFTHLKTFFSAVFPSMVCVAQCYFLFHHFCSFPSVSLYLFIELSFELASASFQRPSNYSFYANLHLPFRPHIGLCWPSILLRLNNEFKLQTLPTISTFLQ